MEAEPLKKELIVVGLDHTPAGTAALRWAVKDAADRGAGVMSVHVYDIADRADLALESDPQGARAADRQRAQEQALQVIGHRRGGPDVRVSVVDGPLVEGLLAAADGAALLVLGRPQGAAHSRLPDQLAASCTCPILLVDEDGNGRVFAPSPHAPVRERSAFESARAWARSVENGLAAKRRGISSNLP